jgi:uncharacterized membrane protein HdeD (DUF308 family)
MNQLVYNWWSVALRGVLAIIVGIIAFVFPGVTLIMWISLFVVYLLLESVLLLVLAFRVRKQSGKKRLWLAVLNAVLNIAVCAIAIIAPIATAVALLYLVAAWAIVAGALGIATAIKLRKEIKREWVLVVHGLLLILFAVLLVAMPAIGLLTLIWMTGAFWLTQGVLLVILAFRLRKEARYSTSTLAGSPG